MTLAQCVAYLARAPKSNSIYSAYKEIQQAIKEQPNAPVPLHIRNAPTSLMKDLGYSKGYIYNPGNWKLFVYSLSDHDTPIHQDYLPDVLQGRKFFHFKIHFDPLAEKH